MKRIRLNVVMQDLTPSFHRRLTPSFGFSAFVIGRKNRGVAYRTQQCIANEI